MRNDRYYLRRNKKLIALAEDLESTLTVIAYGGKENDLDYIKQRQLALKKEYGQRFFCGEPNSFISPHDVPPEKGAAQHKYVMQLLSPSKTKTEDTFVNFMQILSDNPSPEQIRDESEVMLIELVSATKGIVISQN